MGHVLGKYELLRSVAVGGMAELYLARARGLEGFEKLVALKKILPHLAASEDFVSMFLDEARLAAQLSHPNIAQVYDIGFADQSYFFTMEYVQGKDLREIGRAARSAGGLPLEHALTIVCGVAAALHYAHERLGPDGDSLQIVHRDVSPANVLVTFDGGVKLIDFGVAKARGQHSETRAGTLKGKIAYMSPEQCRGESVDRRSDVFALGILLHELTTGARLYKGENDFAILTKIANQDAPAPSLRDPEYPPALEEIVLRALRRDRNDRYDTAEDLQVALERFARLARLDITQSSLRRYMQVMFPDSERALSPPPPATGFATGSGQSLDDQLALLAAAPGTPVAGTTVDPDDLIAPTTSPPAAFADRGAWRRRAIWISAPLVAVVMAVSLFLGTRAEAPHAPPPIAEPGALPATAMAAPAVEAARPRPGPTPSPSPSASPSTSTKPVKSSKRKPTPPAAPASKWDPDSPLLPGGSR